MMADEPIVAQGLNSLTDSRLFLQIKLLKRFLQPDALSEDNLQCTIKQCKLFKIELLYWHLWYHEEPLTYRTKVLLIL